MTDKPKPGGRIDQRALARATRLNRRITEQMRGLTRRELNYSEVLELVYLIGLDLAEQRDALAEMEHIRRGTYGGA